MEVSTLIYHCKNGRATRASIKMPSDKSLSPYWGTWSMERDKEASVIHGENIYEPVYPRKIIKDYKRL